MKPINRAERTNAFYGFLILFLITIGIVVTVVFFSTRVRLTENKRMRTRMLTLEKEKELSDSFRLEMNVVINEMKKYDESKDPSTTTFRSVDLKIKRMGRLLRYMPDVSEDKDRNIYEMVLDNLASLNQAKSYIKENALKN